MEIRSRPEPDPVATLTVVDAYMRWALQASEEVVGKNGLSVVLRQVGLERLVNNYPPNQLKATCGVRFSDYSAFCAGLFEFFGRAGKSMTLRIGRQTARYTIEQQGPLFGTAAVLAAKVLPVASQIRMGLSAGQAGLRKLSQSIGEDRRMALEERDDRFIYTVYDCPVCAGKLADEPMCYVQTGALQEQLRWQLGKEFSVTQTACRATNDPACVWEIEKVPRVVDA